MKRTPLLLITWFSIVALACNLTSNDKPPTLIPQGPIGVPTQATLGYVAPPADASEVTVVAANPSIDIEMFNLVNEVQSDRLMLHISNLVGFHTRHINSLLTSQTEGIGAAANYILRQFEDIRADHPDFAVFPHTFQGFYNDKQSNQRNIIGILQGTDQNAGVILIGAHYDSRNDDLDDAVGASPGADDNGSGVAAVLELARILSQRSHRSTIIFALFSAEEEGRQGSKAFVQDYILHYQIPLIAMINIDTIGSWNAPDGTINDRDIRAFSTGPNDSLARQLARMANFFSYYHALSLTIQVQDRMDREGRYGDHESFTEANYPAIRFIEALEDTPNRDSKDNYNGVEAAYLVDATKTILGVVTALADGLRPPRNVVLRDSGDGSQTLVWEPVDGAARYVVALRRPNSLIYDQHFITLGATSGAWSGWSAYEAVAIAAEDANGLVGPFSLEYKIP
jgi:leucyl aminopeptidase